MRWHLADACALEQLDLLAAREIAAQDPVPLRASTVFDGNAERLSTRRSSQQKSLRCADVYRLGERVLQRMCPVAVPSLRLMRTPVDYVVSRAGDHFDAHSDFEMLAGSHGECSLVLLLCLQAPIEGGELVLHAGEAEETVLEYCEGGAVLFPCRLRHAGRPVVHGEKALLKFDVVATERLWVLSLPAAASRGEVLLGQRVLRCMDALEAQVRFEGLEERGATDLLDVEEMELLSSFFQGRDVDRQNLGLLREALSRLSCPESRLEERLSGLIEGDCVVVVPEDIEAEAFLGRPSAFRLLFVACSHRESAWRFGPPSSAHLQAWCATDFSGRVLLRRHPWDTPTSLEVAPSRAVRETCRLVWEAALLALEADNCDEESFRNFVEKGDSSAECAAALEPAPPALDLATDAAHAVTALLGRQPTSHLSAEVSDVEECNDGDAFRTVRYETTFLRRGYVLMRQPAASPEMGLGDSPPEPSASEEISQLSREPDASPALVPSSAPMM